MSVLVFMSDNRKIESNIDTANYTSLVASINYEYCKLHGYDFIYYRPYLTTKNKVVLHNCIDPNTMALRHASWSKLLSTKKAMELSYNYVVYIDSDCIFKDFNRRIESLIESYSSNDIIFLSNKPWNCDLPCAGFYICKVNDYTRKFINEWFSHDIPEKNIINNWEQDAIWQIYKKYNIAIVDDMMFKEEEGQFLRHIGSHWNNDRIPYFKKFIQDKGINHADNISKINVKDFDTDPTTNVFTMDLTDRLRTSLTKIYPNKITSPMICVEIGSFEGKGSILIHEKMCLHPESMLYCIDPLADVYVKDSDPLLNFWNSACYGQRSRFYRNTANLKNMRLLQGVSDIMIPTVLQKVDFAYIDGDHSPAQVYKDAMNIFDKMRDGGIILFDDYEFTEKGVITADGINRFLSEIKGQYSLLLKSYQLAIRVLKGNDDLSLIALNYKADKCMAFNHTYTPLYNNLLSNVRSTTSLLLEIGIGNIPLMGPLVGTDYKPGASLRMWRDYFPNAQIVGCDILRDVLFTDDRIQTFFVDQSSSESLLSLINNDVKATTIDIIIDDGSHEKDHQRVSFKTLWPYVSSGGTYIIEDIVSYNIDELMCLATECGFTDASISYVHRGGSLWDNFISWKKQ